MLFLVLLLLPLLSLLLFLFLFLLRLLLLSSSLLLLVFFLRLLLGLEVGGESIDGGEDARERAIHALDGVRKVEQTSAPFMINSTIKVVSGGFFVKYFVECNL